MLRAFVAASIFVSAFPSLALAQIMRAGAPGRIVITAPQLHGLITGPAAPLPSLPPSVFSGLDSAPIAHPPIEINSAKVSANSAKAETVKPAALNAVRAAGVTAAEISSHPGSAQSDRARLNFSDGQGQRPAFSEPVVAASPFTPSAALGLSRFSAAAANLETPPIPPVAAPRLAPFLFGTFLAQVASNALQVTMPLLILHATGSAATAAFSATMSSAFDAVGTIIGGRLTDRFGSKSVLVATTLSRGAAVLALPLIAVAGLILPAVLTVYLVESLARGVADTARSTLPSEIAGKNESLLRSILAKNQTFFEAGGIVGPFLAGALIAGAGGAATAPALWLAPVVFGGVALSYLRLSKGTRAATIVPGPVTVAERPRFDGWTKWALAGTALLTLYPLKGLLPAIFATKILADPASAAWLVGLFGVGGLIGSIVYGRLSAKWSLKTWLVVGASGSATFALAFLPGAFMPAALGVLLFSAGNVAARLSLNAALQARAPEGKAGTAVAAARFTANLTSLSVRFLAGLAFAAALAPAASFLIVAGGILVVAVAQFYTARRLTVSEPLRSSPVPIRLIRDVASSMLMRLGALPKFMAGRVENPNPFDKEPSEDAENIRRNYQNKKRGAHFYFRNMLLPMQNRFAELMEMSAVPRVLLHGSPHIDNYAKSSRGAAMVDFDRARIGPYSWDLVRLMVSLSLRQKRNAKGLLAKKVAKALKKGYLRGFRHPERPFKEMDKLKKIEPNAEEITTNAYLDANKKWVKEMRDNALPPNDRDVVALVDSWSKRRGDGILKEYFIEEAGRGRGSMGFRGLFLVVLAPINTASGADRILLNIKATRTDPDTQWYKNPYATEAERMRAAAELYAPGWELRAGSAELNGVEYYVRQMDPFNAKLKMMMGRKAQEDFAYAVGTQLGRAHRLSLRDATPELLEAHLEENFDAILAAGRVIRDEMLDAHSRYLSKMGSSGSATNEDGEEQRP